MARSTQSPILVGLRGVGKIVLLVRIRAMAEELGHRTAFVEAHEGKSLAELLLPSIGAVLPQVLALASESKSYAERLFRYPAIGALPVEDATAAIRSPIEQEEAAISDDALTRILEITQRYPYFFAAMGA